jgi:hypothetical protein
MLRSRDCLLAGLYHVKWKTIYTVVTKIAGKNIMFFFLGDNQGGNISLNQLRINVGSKVIELQN